MNGGKYEDNYYYSVRAGDSRRGRVGACGNFRFQRRRGDFRRGRGSRRFENYLYSRGRLGVMVNSLLGDL